MLIKLLVMYFLLSGIATGLTVLNLDGYYENWCRRHKDATFVERHHIKEVVDDLRSDPLVSMMIALFLGWILVPLAFLNAINNTIQKLLQL